jgi:hypothetical protein
MPAEMPKPEKIMQPATGARSGHPFARMFGARMLLFTKAGMAWRKADYRAWPAEAGWGEPEFVPTAGPSTILFAE